MGMPFHGLLYRPTVPRRLEASSSLMSSLSVTVCLPNGSRAPTVTRPTLGDKGTSLCTPRLGRVPRRDGRLAQSRLGREGNTPNFFGPGWQGGLNLLTAQCKLDPNQHPRDLVGFEHTCRCSFNGE